MVSNLLRGERLILVNADRYSDGIYESCETNKSDIVDNVYFLFYQFYKTEIMFGEFNLVYVSFFTHLI